MAKNTRGAPSEPSSERPVDETQINSPAAATIETTAPDSGVLELFEELRAEVRERLTKIEESFSAPAIAGELEQLRKLLGETLDERHAEVGARIEAVEARFAAIKAALPGLPEPVSREAPPILCVRTRDGRRRHPCAAHTFGAEWTTLRTKGLSQSQLDAITTDPVLQVEESHDD
jgi:hypothetical protein